VATLVTLIGGGVAIYDRFFPAHSGPASLTLSVQGSSDVVKLTDFLRENEGKRIELHLTCADATGPCSMAGVDEQPKGADNEADPHNVLAFLFRERICSDEYGRGGVCAGAWWVYIKTDDSTPDVITQPSGAGSFALDGVFDVRVGISGFVIPPQVTGASLRAVKS
jgi:hypothetical protein